jgi:uncharacterized protein
MAVQVKTQLVIIQPTSFCNINCRYCYLPYRSLTKRVSTETLSRIFEVFFSSSFVPEEITFVWHASEPLVLPIRFYEQAFRLQQQWNIHGVRIINSFQTNAMLITQAWCDFFKEYTMSIGVSIDGPQFIHDANRVDRAGKGTFQRVMSGIALLRANDIRFSAIAVVTKDAVRHADEFWQFFSHLRPTRLGLNPEEAEGINTSSSLGTDAGIEHYRQFFQRLLDLNAQSQQPLLIREVDVLTRRIRQGSPYISSQTNVPIAIISFDCEGNISTFAPEMLTMEHPAYGRFIFGNVFENTLEDIYTHPKFSEINEQIQCGVSRCQQNCEYFMFCGGGSPSNKLTEHGRFDATETISCRLKVKATIDALISHMETVYHIAS